MNILRRLFWAFVQGSTHAALATVGLAGSDMANQMIPVDYQIALPHMTVAGFAVMMLTSGVFNFAKQLYAESQRRLNELGKEVDKT